MPDLYLIFNHETTALQEADARRSLGIGRVVDLPPELKALWCGIPPDLPQINHVLQPLQQWLEQTAAVNDYVLIQGDFGACFLMVNFALAMGLIPVYSTTDRQAVERRGPDGSVTLTHRFEHRIFRKYGG